jgi:drug/metabolite transporter (DMT)-like permease
LTILFALLSALSNAFNVATQHVASTAAPRRAKGWRFVVYLFTSPLWLLGWVALAAAFVFQALALHRGQVSVVQPLLVTELVFVLVLRRVWIRQDIRLVTWGAAAVTCIALAIFLAVSEPTGGKALPANSEWVSAASVTVGLAALLALVGSRGSAPRRAALNATATAMLWALVAVLIKTMTETLARFGVGGMFMHWPVYALAAAGLVAEVLNQVTLHVGPLSVSQPFLVIVDPIFSILLSVWIFDEYFTANGLRVAVAAVAFAVMCAAVVVLTRTAPATMQPEKEGASKATP